MTEPIEALMREHRTIEDALSALSRFAAGPPDAGRESRETVAAFAEFFRTFADRCHHGKEEDLLFAEMTRAGVPSHAGPIAVMLQEHQAGRAYVAELTAVGEKTGPLGPEELETIARVAAEYVPLLRAHIQKEDGILYPMAEQVLEPAALDALDTRFREFDEATFGPAAHEDMRALADKLVAACGS